MLNAIYHIYYITFEAHTIIFLFGLTFYTLYKLHASSIEQHIWANNPALKKVMLMLYKC